MRDQEVKRLELDKFVSKRRYLDTELELTELQFKIYNRAFSQEFACEISEAETRRNKASGTKSNEGTQQTAVQKAFQSDAAPDVTEGLTRDNFEAGRDMEYEPQRTQQTDTDETDMIAKYFGKLYKRLALMYHPDKPGGDERIFRQLSEAMADEDYLKLLTLAKDSKLSLDVNSLHHAELSRRLQTNIEKTESKIDRYKRTVAWVWGEAVETDNDVTKQHSLRQRISQSILQEQNVFG